MKSKTLVILILAVFLCALVTARAQKKEKPWTEWSKKEAEKILNDSPWAQTQTDTDTSQQFYTPTSDPNLGARKTDTTDSRIAQGATNQAINVTYRVRFFSARPIREAHVRLMELQQKPSPDVEERLRNFAEVQSTNSIIVTVSCESNDQRYLGPVMQAFNSAVTATLKSNAYLERNDGKRLFLEEYVPPGKDGFGARFIFLRNPEEQPFITEKTTDVRFVAQYSSAIKIDRRFKLADMKYNGALEY